MSFTKMLATLVCSILGLLKIWQPLKICLSWLHKKGSSQKISTFLVFSDCYLHQFYAAIVCQSNWSL